jgi:hypothetical protein
MKSNKYLLLCLLTLFCFAGLSQRRSFLTQVSTNNPINGAPFLILPKAAIKLNFSLVEFTYARGEKLKNLITVKKTGGTDEELKKDLKFLEKEYDINTEVIIKMIRPGAGQEEVKITKMDKDIKTSFVSLANYNRIFKYTKASGINNSSLNLEYDANGILISSKVTDESRLLPTIFSAVSGFASIATAAKAKSATFADETALPVITGTYLDINRSETKKLDELIESLNAHLKGTNTFTEKQFLAGKEKREQDIAKEFAELFYAKEVKIIPMEIIFSIPDNKTPSDPINYTNMELFFFQNNKIKINDAYKDNYLVSPQDRFEFVNSLSKPYTLQLATVPAAFDKSQGLSGITGTASSKITAVYNIPKTERIRLQKPAVTEALFDTAIKIPQHGPIGYYSMRLSTVDLAYDNNGEIKKLSFDKKSVFDATLTQGATSIKDVVTAFKKEKEKTELELLTEQATKLELLKKIHDLEHSED